MNTYEQSGSTDSEYPPSPPPVVVPHYVRVFMDVPYILKNHLHRFIYIWTINEGSFWMYPIAVMPGNRILGYKWDRNFWRLIELDTSQIDSLY